MDEQPDQPGQQAGNVDAKNIGHRGGAADYGHLALIEIMKWRRFFLPIQTRTDDFCRVRSALHRDLRDTGQRYSFLIDSMSKIANDENIRKMEDGQIAMHLNSAAAIRFPIRSLCKFPAERSGRNSAGPEHGFRCQHLAGISAFE